MCDPISMGALIVASTATQVAGQAYSGLAANAQAGYEAKLAKRNALFETERARDAIDRGQDESQRYQRRAGQDMGAQNAALAANGIDITFGSAADVRGDLATDTRADVRTIGRNAYREARGFEINAANYHSEAKAQKMRGRGALISTGFGIGTTILGGAQQYRAFQARRY